MRKQSADSPEIEFYKEHMADFERVCDLLEDDFSKKTYRAVIQFRMTFDIKNIEGLVVQPPYFLKDILPPYERETFVDGGAFDGLTALEFARDYNPDSYDMIYLWECDEKNIASIEKNLRDVRYRIVPYAMWDKEETLHFAAYGTDASKVVLSGGEEVNANSIDRVHAGQRVTFLKMDIEGSELAALRGAERTIKEQKPKLAISIYHLPSHLYEIPLLIKEMVPEYKFYIRHHSDTFSDTVLYAICPP